MERPFTFSDAGIGKKALVAVSGAVLFGFVIVHMIGNLQIFLGPEALNGYSRALHRLPEFLWLARFVLVTSIAVHIVASLALVRQSSAARPIAYRVQRSLATTYAARTMKWSGPLILVFVLYHLAHFTWPGIAMGDYRHDPHDVYANVVNGFRVPWVVAIYVVAQTLLGLHLSHGAWSLFQSLGLSHPRYDRLRRWLPRAFAFAVVGGNVAMPLAVLAGLVR
jgi:succinate dehydrogenase / fumarate reductase, cytochrome b subunit